MNNEDESEEDMPAMSADARPSDTPLTPYGEALARCSELEVQLDAARIDCYDYHKMCTRIWALVKERDGLACDQILAQDYAASQARVAELDRQLAHVKGMDKETLQACQHWIAENNRAEAQVKELADALGAIVGVIDAHEIESCSCDRDGETHCDCLRKESVKAKAALAKLGEGKQ